LLASAAKDNRVRMDGGSDKSESDTSRQHEEKSSYCKHLFFLSRKRRDTAPQRRIFSEKVVGNGGGASAALGQPINYLSERQYDSSARRVNSRPA
jgi:hypothetical protein